MRVTLCWLAVACCSTVPARAAPCNRPDLVESLPPDGAQGMPLNASLIGHYSVSAEYLDEPVLVTEEGVGEVAVSVSFDRAEGLLRAARVDGAGVWQTFWHVIVPHLRSVILICTILLFVTNLNSFTLIFLMTGGGPAGATTIWIIAVYALGFLTPNYGLASAFAVILFLIMVVLGYFYVRALSGDRDRRQTA